MRSIFIDTNIIVDLLADRKPYSNYAIELFKIAEQGKIKLFTSSHSIATTYYILKKHIPEKGLRTALFTLLDYIKVIAVDENILKKSLKSNFKDFEDGIQVISANSNQSIDLIVTRNPKDFKGSNIKIISPEKLIKEL